MTQINAGGKLRMAENNDPLITTINRQVNTIAAHKQYRQAKKVMEDFDSRLQQELTQPIRVDRKIS